MRVLLFGADGQVGRAIVTKAANSGVELIANGKNQVDIRDYEQVFDQVKSVKPNFLVNAAAYTNVNGAECEKELAEAVNTVGPRNLAKACRQQGVPLIHLSTEYVFDGLKKGAYIEADPTCPINLYGLTKEQGEKAVRLTLSEHIILRTSWVFSESSSAFPAKILKNAKRDLALSVVSDQIGNPTSADSIARAVFRIIDKSKVEKELPWGTYHFCQNPAVSGLTSHELLFRKRGIKTY